MWSQKKILWPLLSNKKLQKVNQISSTSALNTWFVMKNRAAANSEIVFLPEDHLQLH